MTSSKSLFYRRATVAALTTAAGTMVGTALPALAQTQPQAAQQTTKPADAPVTLPKVVVEESKTTGSSPWFEPSSETTGTAYTLDPKGIATMGTPGGVNPYRAVSGLPSVHAPSIDPYGLSNIPGGNKGLRIRGELSTHGGSATIEGLPINAPGPGPGALWLIDSENWSSVTVHQGAMPPDRLSPFNGNGIVDMALLWPQKKLGGQVSLGAGSFDFRRVFARADSGNLGNSNTRFFVSSSYTDADKWRGPGKAVDDRRNYEGAIASDITEKLSAKIFLAYNKYSANNYRALTYDQARNLSVYNSFDYLPNSSSVATDAINYYGYNRQNFENTGIFSEVSYKFTDTTSLTVKPYFMKEKGQFWDGQASGKVRNWLIDHEWYGIVSELKTKLADTDIKVGHWWSSMEPPGPPLAWKMYNPTASGGLTGASWSILAKNTERHDFQSVYAMADRRFGKLRVQAGGRYVWERLPGIDQYNTTGIGDVSYDTALAQSSGVVRNRSVSAFTVGEFLPYASAAYDLTPDLTAKVSAGRTYGAPALDVWPTYQQNSAAFLAKGLTANDIWQKLKPETGNQVDVGLRWAVGKGTLEPTIYYARYHNKTVSYDPGVGVAYGQNVGETHAYGVQLAGNYAVTDTINLFGSASWNRNVFDEALPVLPGATAAQRAAANSVVGGQIPDAPLWMGAVGMAWQWENFTLTPVVRYVGERWGDTSHTQKIPGYLLTDITASYEHQLSFGPLTASLSVLNLFDKRYIGQISASYLQSTSGTNAYYYQGAPRTVVGRLNLKF